MAKKLRKLDEFLHARKLSQDSVLEKQGALANLVFRALVAFAVSLFLVALVEPRTPGAWVGLGVVFAIVTLLGALAVRAMSPGVFQGAASFNRFVILTLATVLAYRLVLAVRWPVYLSPLPAFAMVAGLAYSQISAILVVIALSFYLGLLAPLSSIASDSFVGSLVGSLRLGESSSVSLHLPMVVASSLGGVVAVLGMGELRRQSRPVEIGFYVGIVQALTVVCFQGIVRGFDLTSAEGQALAGEAGQAIASGLGSGVLLTSFLPSIERFFGVVTQRRLLELADPSQPLLQVLRERAPGTFQHTLNVQQLARNAAEAIGADVLLAEVGAYYHDIGKICKPGYFVENMGPDKTIHERLRPSMSKMIIVSHVKEGIQLARDEKLPERIIDMIPMHHGTTIVEFFFRKAQKESTEEEGSPVEETTYRYPGPRPRFAEAGILMLADAVEAIAKTIKEPSSTRFRDMINGIVMKRLEDGQLDECPLTIADLRKIEDSFVRTLMNVYHSRIDYATAGEGPTGVTTSSHRLPIPDRPRMEDSVRGLKAL
jgi:putative nucleotidyltransferase with HDIG domain